MATDSVSTMTSPTANSGTLSLARKRQIIAVLAVVWLFGSGFALYQLQTAGQRLFDPSVLETDSFPIDFVKAELMSSLPQTGTPLIIHAWDDRCSCADLAWQHLVSMQEQIRAAGAQVVFLVKPGDAERAESAVRQLASEASIPVAGVILDRREALVPASPAAMVVSEGGELVYLGPYSAGGACVTSLGGFVESSLRVAPADFQETWVNRAVMGCYCDWRTPDVSTV